MSWSSRAASPSPSCARGWSPTASRRVSLHGGLLWMYRLLLLVQILYTGCSSARGCLVARSGPPGFYAELGIFDFVAGCDSTVPRAVYRSPSLLRAWAFQHGVSSSGPSTVTSFGLGSRAASALSSIGPPCPCKRLFVTANVSLIDRPVSDLKWLSQMHAACRSPAVSSLELLSSTYLIGAIYITLSTFLSLSRPQIPLRPLDLTSSPFVDPRSCLAWCFPTRAVNFDVRWLGRLVALLH